jgi:hypothetical protein
LWLAEGVGLRTRIVAVVAGIEEDDLEGLFTSSKHAGVVDPVLSGGDDVIHFPELAEQLLALLLQRVGLAHVIETEVVIVPGGEKKRIALEFGEARFGGELVVAFPDEADVVLGVGVNIVADPQADLGLGLDVGGEGGGRLVLAMTGEDGEAAGWFRAGGKCGEQQEGEASHGRRDFSR